MRSDKLFCSNPELGDLQKKTIQLDVEYLEHSGRVLISALNFNELKKFTQEYSDLMESVIVGNINEYSVVLPYEEYCCYMDKKESLEQIRKTRAFIFNQYDFPTLPIIFPQGGNNATNQKFK